MKKRIIVELELVHDSDDKDLIEEEIKNDIQKNQDQIGLSYYYIVKNVQVVEQK